MFLKKEKNTNITYFCVPSIMNSCCCGSLYFAVNENNDVVLQCDDCGCVYKSPNEMQKGTYNSYGKFYRDATLEEIKLKGWYEFVDLEYISINDKRYDVRKILKNKKLYQILKKYENYEKIIDLSNDKQINNIVNKLFNDLINIKILCKNYKDFIIDFDNLTLDDINNFDLLKCLALLTMIQRVDYHTGGYGDIYPKYTKNNFIPSIIKKVINKFE